jgi:hypothetical protein
MGIRQLLLAASLPSIYSYSGVLTVGGYSYETPDPPPFEFQSLTGFGDYFGVFGDLSPVEMLTLIIQQFYYEYSDISGVITDQLFLQSTGTDALSTKYPTLNDYPMVNGGIVGSVNTAGLLVNVSQNLLQLKYLGLETILRFALRTDIIQAAGTSTLTVPSGSTRAVIYGLGGGGGGARTASSRFGGGNGAYCISDIAVSSGQWGTSMSYTVGAAGVGRVSSAGNGTAGGATTITHAGLGVSISAGGGGGGTTTANGTGGTASGGATSNTNGSAGTSATGYNPANEIAFQNSHQGGQGGVGANGTNGRAGLVAVVWY